MSAGEDNVLTMVVTTFSAFGKCFTMLKKVGDKFIP